VDLLSWIKGLLQKEERVTYTPLRQKIRDYNKKEHEEHMKLVRKRASVEKNYWKYFR